MNQTSHSKRLTATKRKPDTVAAVSASLCAMTALLAGAAAARADDLATNSVPDKWWNLHFQNTDIFDYHPGIRSDYSGPNSLEAKSESQDTVSLDLMAGARLWEGAEFHVDGLMWQGFGFSSTLGIENFPNSEAYRLGTQVPNVNFTRVFLRQTFGLGGEQETVEDDETHLAGKQDVSRVTITAGRFSAKDIFDNNAYANDGRAQFLSWGLVANEAWDYPADSIGFTSGLSVELNQQNWTARYGFFQVPRVANSTAQDKDYLNAWGMVTEFEHRQKIGDRPGAVRFLAYLNHANMGSYVETVDNPSLGEDITQTRQYRYKYGFCFNAEQEIVENIGLFLRGGWSDGQNQAWMFSDVDESFSGGFSFKGALWHRTDDTLGLGCVLSGISSEHQRYLAAGGTGILSGDGKISYAPETSVEAYYDIGIWKTIHAALDYQFVNNPAFNQDRGPVSVISVRLHWTF